MPRPRVRRGGAPPRSSRWRASSASPTRTSTRLRSLFRNTDRWWRSVRSNTEPPIIYWARHTSPAASRSRYATSTVTVNWSMACSKRGVTELGNVAMDRSHREALRQSRALAVADAHNRATASPRAPVSRPSTASPSRAAATPRATRPWPAPLPWNRRRLHPEYLDGKIEISADVTVFYLIDGSDRVLIPTSFPTEEVMKKLSIALAASLVILTSCGGTGGTDATAPDNQAVTLEQGQHGAMKDVTQEQYHNQADFKTGWTSSMPASPRLTCRMWTSPRRRPSRAPTCAPRRPPNGRSRCHPAPNSRRSSRVGNGEEDEHGPMHIPSHKPAPAYADMHKNDWAGEPPTHNIPIPKR